MPSRCELNWCNSETKAGKWFCTYHWGKLGKGQQELRDTMTTYKPLKNNDYIISDTFFEAYKKASEWLTKEHETMVDCPKCKGRGVNTGHSSYLRGKQCSWCDNGKRAKIY